VAPLIFLFETAFQLHDKEFAYHLSLFPRVETLA